jgi:hypothetical protein
VKYGRIAPERQLLPPKLRSFLSDIQESGFDLLPERLAAPCSINRWHSFNADQCLPPSEWLSADPHSDMCAFRSTLFKASKETF